MTDVCKSVERGKAMPMASERTVESEKGHKKGLSTRPFADTVASLSRRSRLSGRASVVCRILSRVRDVSSNVNQQQLLDEVCVALAESGLYSGVWGRLLTVDARQSYPHASPSSTQLDASLDLSLAPCVQQALGGDSVVMLPPSRSKCASCPMSEDCRDTTRIVLGLKSAHSVHGVLSIGLKPSQRLSSAEIQVLHELANEIAIKLDRISDYHRLRLSDTRAPNLYRTIFENTGTAMWIVDERGIVTLVNRRFESMTGYRREDIEGKMHWEVLFRPDDLPAMREIRRRRLAGDQCAPDQYEALLVICDGSVVPVLKTATLIPFTQSVLTSLMDLTQEKRAYEAQRQAEAKAQQAQRLASVGEMAAGVAHEINNPITGIIGFADLLLRGRLPADTAEHVRSIREAGHRVADIVSELLAFARWRTPDRQPVELNGLITDALEALRPRLSSSEVKVDTQFDEDSLTICADPRQIEEVLVNIVCNAETAMRLAHGAGTLTIALYHQYDAAIVEFQDSGPGIPEAYLDRIFDPFFTTRDVGQGTGLGLSICHGIVTEHGGRISARNNSMGGATITVELPLKAKSTSRPGTLADSYC